MTINKFIEILYKTHDHFNLSNIHNSHQNCSDFSRASLMLAQQENLKDLVKVIMCSVKSNIDYDAKLNLMNRLADCYVKNEWYGHELLKIDDKYYDFTLKQFGYENGMIGKTLPDYIQKDVLEKNIAPDSSNNFYKYMNQLAKNH